MITYVDLYSGIGGLSLGLRDVSAKCLGMFEADRNCIETIRRNSALFHFDQIELLQPYNANSLDLEYLRNQVDLVLAGPPCQPFSFGGRSLRDNDTRDGFPNTVRLIGEILPKLFIIENVPGLLGPRNLSYFNYLIEFLKNPTLKRGQSEHWETHALRLRKQKRTSPEEQYEVHSKLLVASDYGVPQIRKRVFIVGIRRNVNSCFGFPKATHVSQTSSLFKEEISLKNWPTVTDAILDLPDPLSLPLKTDP